MKSREQARGKLRDRVARCILDLQSLDQMAECGQGGAGEGGGGLLRDGELEAFEDGGLRGLGAAVVLDVAFERVEQVDLAFRRCCRPFEGRQECGRLQIHL